MADNEKFPVPVSGQPIPRGWFARLVRFINSLILHGDNQYVMVNRTDAGTTITLTPSLINDLTKAAAPAAGGASGIESNVTGGTASITLTGGSGSVNMVGTGSINISGNTNGEIELHGGGGIPFSGVNTASIRLDNGSHVYQHDGWARMSVIIESLGNSAYLGLAYLRVIQNNVTTDHLVAVNGFNQVEGSAGGSLMIPVVSGSTVLAYIDMDSNYSIAYSSLPNEILIFD